MKQRLGEMRQCEECGALYRVYKSDQRFCCHPCHVKWHNRAAYNEVKKMKAMLRKEQAFKDYVY